MADRIRKLTATTPAGIFTRRTHRDYTHVVVYGTGDNASATWHRGIVNARKALNKHLNYLARWAPEKRYDVEIHLVDGADVVELLKGAF